jgi:mono/diheme cytochrome c family protein
MNSLKYLNPLMLLSFLLAFNILASCTYNKEDELYGIACDTTNVRYSVEIKNVVSASCVGCHNGQDSQGGVNLETYELVKESVDKKEFLESIINEVDPMPKGGPRLSSCRINQIRAWINQGAPNN